MKDQLLFKLEESQKKVGELEFKIALIDTLLTRYGSPINERELAHILTIVQYKI